MRCLIPVIAAALALPCIAAASEFDAVVQEFERQTGSVRTQIPFFGLARFIVAVGHPAGASDLRLAVFEHPNVLREDFSRVSDAIVGASWKRMVRVRSRRGEMTSIYSRQDGNHLRLLIASVDKDDATFVEVRIRPDKLVEFVDEHRGHH